MWFDSGQIRMFWPAFGGAQRFAEPIEEGGTPGGTGCNRLALDGKLRVEEFGTLRILPRRGGPDIKGGERRNWRKKGDIHRSVFYFHLKPEEKLTGMFSEDRDWRICQSQAINY
jgi:hypothetical protein